MNNDFVKIVVFVPEIYADALRQTIREAGAGQVSNYKGVSFSTKGIGRFEPQKGANPTIGAVGELEAVQEERIEMICHKDNVATALKKIKEVHPYEEPATDIYPLIKI